MNWHNVLLILKREIRDQLRDRRTLFMVAVVPVLLYPLMGIGMVQMMLLFTEQPRTVVILGTDELPAGLLKEGTFDPELFNDQAEAKRFASKLRVVRDVDKNSDSDQLNKKGPTPKELIASAEWLRKEYQQLYKTEDPLLRSAIKRKMNEFFGQCGIDTLIVVPVGFREHLEKINQQLQNRNEEININNQADQPRLAIVHNSASEKSRLAYGRVSQVTDKWEKQLLVSRLKKAKLPLSIVSPVQPMSIDLAEAEEFSATLWSKLFPALLVLMTVTGAFYPAIDVAAGEKERGTMETLLICPASRTEIVLGKFFTVMAFSVSTALLNLISMGFTGKYMASVTGGSMSHLGNIAPPSLQALLWVGVLMVPLATLFSALCLALSTFARSTKEGQYYLTPLLMIVLGLTMFCLSPAIEITPFYSVLPVIGPALLLKELLASNGQSLGYVVPVLGASVGYSLLALWWAIDQFSKEDVLFREAELFDIKSWARNLFANKTPLPTFVMAAFCFIFMILLQFGTSKIIADLKDSGRFGLDEISMIHQVSLIAVPVLIMGFLFTTSIRQTFKLNLPPLKMWFIAAGLAFVLHPLSGALLGLLDGFFPELPPQIVEQFSKIMSPDMPLWKVLLAVALTPAICEELAFRGFILSGFSRTGRTGIAIVLSSFLFGLIHMIPIQVFNATLLGMVIGLIAVRSNSIFPGMLFHFINNSLSVLHQRIKPDVITFTGWQEWFFSYQSITNKEGAVTHVLDYNLPTLVLCFLIAIPMMYLLLTSKREKDVHSQ